MSHFFLHLCNKKNRFSPKASQGKAGAEASQGATRQALYVTKNLKK
jgi:hypothetical protein